MIDDFNHNAGEMKTKIKNIIVTGTISGIIMGFSLFIGGAILSRIIYGPFNINDQIFWPLYQLCGYLGFGASFGFIYRRTAQEVENPSVL